jgi:SAM-dependent methyltransferase
VTAPRAARDYFSRDPSSYAAFRPRYPDALFDQLAALAPRRGTAWDCAAGTGQATLALAERFERVIASDMSAAQVAVGARHPRVTWIVAPAEASTLADHSADLVTVAQALHWFDQSAFFAEARRVAAPNAVIAAWSYGSAELDGAVGDAVRRFEHQTLGVYWPPERAQVADAYASIVFPFEELSVDAPYLEQQWTLEHMLGYIHTWSATTRYIAKHGTSPLPMIARVLEPLWGDPQTPRLTRWPLTVRAGRIAPGD